MKSAGLAESVGLPAVEIIGKNWFLGVVIPVLRKSYDRKFSIPNHS